MNDLHIFENQEIRITELNGERRMAAVDACKALGYTDSSTNWSVLKKRNSELAIEALPIKLIGNDGIGRNTDTLNLEGVILLCMLARTEKALQFRQWAKKILANQMQSDYQIPQTYSEALQLAADQAKQIEVQQAKIKEDKPKVDFYDEFQGIKGAILVKKAGKLLGIGGNKIYEFMRKEKIIIPGKKYEPYQKYFDQGYFKYKVGYHNQGTKRVYHETLMVTPKGYEWLWKRWNGITDQPEMLRLESN